MPHKRPGAGADAGMHRTDKTLHGRDEIYQLIMNNTRDLIVMVAPDGTPLYISPSSTALLGYAPAELMDGEIVHLVHPDDRERALEAFRASMRDRDGRSVELRCRHRDGEWRNFECVGSWILSGAKPHRAVLILRDISKRKRAEEDLKNAYTQLEHRESELITALAFARHSHTELQEAHLRLIHAAKMQSVGRLAAGVAHEVKNPLTVIMMGVEYISRHLGSASDDVRDVLRDMDEAITRANSVVRGLLDFSAPGTLELESVALQQVIDKAIVLMKHEFARAQVRVECDLAPDTPLLQLDHGKIEQVFVNLFLNAVQAMPKGGTIRVRSRLHPAAATRGATGAAATAAAAEAAVVVEVVDSGCGIPADKLDRVFDPFFTTKRSGEGTGLGLTVVQRIIEMHGATIELTNAPSGGLRVSLAFATKEGGSASQTQGSGGGRRGGHDAPAQAQSRRKR